jgi:hypothetical protein
VRHVHQSQIRSPGVGRYTYRPSSVVGHFPNIDQRQNFALRVIMSGVALINLLIVCGLWQKISRLLR